MVGLKRYNYCTSRRLLILMAVCMLGSCIDNKDKSKAKYPGENTGSPSVMPNLKERREVLALSYRSPTGVRKECLGRLVFDLEKAVEWPRFHNKDSSQIFNRSFSAHISHAGDEMRYGDTLIAVINAETRNQENELLRDLPVRRIADYQELIKEKEKHLDKIKGLGTRTQKDSWQLHLAENAIQSWENAIDEDTKNFESFDPGLPDSNGYWTSEIEGGDDENRYSIFRAYLTRTPHIFVFESAAKFSNLAEKESHRRRFLALLKSFQVRTENEIPSAPGVCIPFGFFPDDGRTKIEFKQSFRFKDAPGVLYNIQTGDVHWDRMKASPLEAIAFSRIRAPAPSDAVDSVIKVTQRIGPSLHKIGGLMGTRGGVVLGINQGSPDAYEMYDVFTGYSGWLGSAVLPYIFVEMRSVNREQAEELQSNPPVFSQSMGRLELLLKSMRYRPTVPEMAEFNDK
jgi:hypothetical protein